MRSRTLLTAECLIRVRLSVLSKIIGYWVASARDLSTLSPAILPLCSTLNTSARTEFFWILRRERLWRLLTDRELVKASTNTNVVSERGWEPSPVCIDDHVISAGVKL